ncbi:phospholipase D-like domain-containing protein [Verminephrobacter eiseniae]|uniref:hypothetical protein n=1 Tax=Verminephrobacter eiseniae TaxID=364317 RepID=UPI00223910E9|nr:hypothetical protein [Verminephrobacter eiseniae]
MELIDNISRLLGDDLKQTIRPGARLKIAASCFSMYAFEALKAALEKIDELDFIFTSPTFVANEVTDKIRKEQKEFHSHPQHGWPEPRVGRGFQARKRARRLSEPLCMVVECGLEPKTTIGNRAND